MNTTRKGKIARLPKALRQQLNVRLQDGELGEPLLAWLNALPQVQAIVAAHFEGKPISAQNLSEWRKGGYQDWLTQEEALELVARLGEDAKELAAATKSQPLTDALALWVTARYAVASRKITQTEGEESWKQLREMCADLVKLRRGDQNAERLRLEGERVEIERERKVWTEEKLLEWARNPENEQRIWTDRLSPEERAERIREIFQR